MDDDNIVDEEMNVEMEQLLDEDGNPIPREDDGPKLPQNPLKPELLKKSLKKLSKTYNGLSYAYIELDLKEKELDDIGEDLSNYIHLRDINISINKFTQINPIGNMTYLVRLDASKNEIKEIEVFSDPERLQFLQILNLKENIIKELPEMNTKSLTELYLDTNRIESCINFKGLPSLKKLNLNQNKLKNCEGLANMPMLEVIYLNENNIKSMKGLEKLDNLRKLRLKNNKIENLLNEFVPNLPNLEKLNISENQIKDVKQFSALKFPKLKKINVEANPYFEEANAGAKIEIVLQLPDIDIKFVNKEEITNEDREESVKVKVERIQKEKEEAEEKERQRIQEELERREREEEERKVREAEREAEEERKKQEALELEEQERIKKEAEMEGKIDGGDMEGGEMGDMNNDEGEMEDMEDDN